MTAHRARALLTRLGVATAHPAAFGVLTLYTASWLIFERETFDWHATATLATWLMTLFIQRAEHRDMQAIHVKLDELLKANGEARTELGAVDDQEPEEIVKLRKDERET